MRTDLSICFVAYEYLPHFTSPDELLDDFFSLTDWCEALAAKGCKVSAVVRFKETKELVRKGITYYFVQDQFGPKLKFWQIPKAVHQKVVAIKPTVIHTHNMNKVLQHNHLANIIIGKIPILVQNHAEWPLHRLRIWMQRRVFRKLQAFLFCAHGQERAWQEEGILKYPGQIHFVMEGSTHFLPQDKLLARNHTGIGGDPIFLWVGNLNSNKDPLTILSAFSEVLPLYPTAQLYMIYRHDDLLVAVREKIDGHELLRKSVTLLGEKTRAALEAYYNSADYFLLGSHREGSGYALMEAMACGCIPIVTNIPTFRMMTKEGQLGGIFSPGNRRELVETIKVVLEKRLEKESVAVRKQFEEALSYQAIADKMVDIYAGLAKQND